MGFDTEWRPTMCRAGTDERFVTAGFILECGIAG